MAQLLLTKGAHVNAADKKDRKPIHWAAYMGESSCLTRRHTGSGQPYDQFAEYSLFNLLL